ncbi:LysR substrate-binding domain-containing protein (plasmid) [Limimaricola variabilis]|uniref:LysR substrate-binding domain-containing protein n=1 Tax=Limimaricola variabilis TaxID=1492771 RepID=UPI002AC9B33E|nr:LysR substrate-binding domain-containing protein [Limimaricola variabilis]WPY96536.1 LysR substrate-binding domain-containing protein [Limimaricola variabilis]
MTPFRAIAVFYHVATLNSVMAAADQLGVTASAVSQQLRALEAQVGTVLVTRQGRRIRLTEAGERYFELISDQVEGLIRATETMRGTRTTATLTIRATPTVSTKWLLPRLPGFLDANPSIDVRLDGTNEPTDFARDPVDLEIRHGTGRWPGLHVLPLAEESFVPVCAPRLAPPRSIGPEDLVNFRLIQSLKAQVQWPAWFAAQDLPTPNMARRLSFDRSHMAVDAAVLGLGVALESTLMMERELAGGMLVQPLRDAPAIRITTQWLVCPPANLRRSRVRRFIDWIAAEARSWQISQSGPNG